MTKTVKEEMKEILGFKKMQKVAIERLHPPMAPKIVDEKSDEVLWQHSVGTRQIKAGERFDSVPDSTSTIDYETIARSSEFQRFIYFLLTGKTHRGKQVHLRQEVKAKMTKFRGSGMGDVINEFKEKVERMRNE